MKLFDRKQFNLVFSTAALLPNLYIGNRVYNYFFPRKANVILYITNRCNSRCKICNHWQQTPKVDLPFNIIEKLLNSRSVNKNGFLIEGGEVILHPEFEEIIKLLKGRKFELLSNGIDTERLLRIVDKYNIPSVCISLDGVAQAYKEIRGVDKYGDVLKSLRLLKDNTDLVVSFTISPWNNFDDFLRVKEICSKEGFKLVVNIFSKMKYMGVAEEEIPVDKRYESLDTPYACLYNQWVKGELKVPCFSMRFLTVIRPNGDVALCQYKNIILGNLYERSFDQIWNDERTKKIQRVHMACNDCWVSSHRAFDVKFNLMVKKVLPFLNLR